MARRGAAVRAALAALALSAATAAAADSPPAPVTTLGPIEKEHNVTGAHGLLYLRLRVPATILRERGSDVALGVWFADESGSLIPANLPEYRDRSGLLVVESPTVRVAEDPERRELAVTVPYGAFPKRRDGAKRYSVEARAMLLRRSAPQTRLALATTKFLVEE
jgi:hypothetical protein